MNPRTPVLSGPSQQGAKGMLQRHETTYFLPAPFALSLCGVLFCIWNLLGGITVPCPGSGCTVFNDFTIAGVSLWWIGAFGFTLLALCALFGRLHLGKALAACGLWCDVGLLGVMLVTTSCIPCMLVAVLLALTYFSFVQTASTRRRPAKTAMPILLGIWGLLLLANLGAFAHSLSTPWPMLEAHNESARAYVSPSCPACRQLIRETPAAQIANISWYPVAESEQDMRVIAVLLQELKQGRALQDAFTASLEQPLSGTWTLLRPDMLLLRLRLWRNQAHVLENGGVIPRLEFLGLPAFMVQPTAQGGRAGHMGQSGQAGQPGQSGQPGQAGQFGQVTPQSVPSSGSSDVTLPGELSILGRCTDSNPSQVCE